MKNPAGVPLIGLCRHRTDREMFERHPPAQYDRAMVRFIRRG